MEKYISVGNKLSLFADMGTVCDSKDEQSAQKVATFFFRNPSYIGSITSLLLEKGIANVAHTDKSGNYCLVLEPEGVDNFAIKIELKLPGMDYSMSMVPQMLQPLTTIFSDEHIHITTIPYVHRFLSELSLDEIKPDVIRLITSLYESGWLFWDPKPDAMGIITDSKGQERIVITDPNALVRIEKQHEVWDSFDGQSVTYREAFALVIQQQYNFVTKFVDRIELGKQPDCLESPNFWAQVAMQRTRFPNGYDIETKMPNDSQMSR